MRGKSIRQLVRQLQLAQLYERRIFEVGFRASQRLKFPHPVHDHRIAKSSLVVGAAIEEVVVRQVCDVTAMTPVEQRRDPKRSIVELVGEAHCESRILIAENVEMINSADECSA